MKRIIGLILAVVLVVSLLLTLASCGNKQIFDTTYKFDYALVQFPDGTCEKIEIQKWDDYDGEQIRITSKDGTTYLVNSVNCILVSE